MKRVEWYTCRWCGSAIRRIHAWIDGARRALCDIASAQLIDGPDHLGFHQVTEEDFERTEADRRQLDEDVQLERSELRALIGRTGSRANTHHRRWRLKRRITRVA